jgi:hypothetical protein
MPKVQFSQEEIVNILAQHLRSKGQHPNGKSTTSINASVQVGNVGNLYNIKPQVSVSANLVYIALEVETAPQGTTIIM